MSKDNSSYTCRLFNNPKLLNEKILEEARELTRTKNKKQVIWESADLLYFVLVFLAKRKVKLKQVEKKLESRNKKRKKILLNSKTN